MSDGLQTAGKIWTRLFNHGSVLEGEISFLLNELEVKRGDCEVDSLFSCIENIAEIKDIQVDKVKLALNGNILEAKRDLAEALDKCNQIAFLESTYKTDTSVEEARLERQKVWDSFMKTVTTNYSEINQKYEVKQEELQQSYLDLEKKLLTQ